MDFRGPSVTLIGVIMASGMFMGSGVFLPAARDAVTASRRPAAEHSAGYRSTSWVAAGY